MGLIGRFQLALCGYGGTEYTSVLETDGRKDLAGSTPVIRTKWTIGEIASHLFYTENSGGQNLYCLPNNK
jgi:hypothetical protein